MNVKTWILPSYKILHFVMTFEHSKNSKISDFILPVFVWNKQVQFQTRYKLVKPVNFPHFLSFSLTDERYGPVWLVANNCMLGWERIDILSDRFILNIGKQWSKRQIKSQSFLDFDNFFVYRLKKLLITKKENLTQRSDKRMKYGMTGRKN